MEVATGIMLVATGVFSAAESPRGHVGFFGDPDDPRTQDVQEAVSDVFDELQQIEARRPQDQRMALILSMQRIAERFG